MKLFGPFKNTDTFKVISISFYLKYEYLLLYFFSEEKLFKVEFLYFWNWWKATNWEL